MPFRRGQLLYFVTVAEEGQITRAAKRLHIAQPALSQSIAQLEADLGIELLARHARGVSLTPAGEAFLTKARAALAAWTDAVLTAQSFAQAVSGTIEFGFVGSPPGLDSPGPLQAFASSYPEIDVCYRELPFPSASTSSWLSGVDVAVCAEPPPDPAVWTHELRIEPRVLLAPRRHPLAEHCELEVRDVLDETFIGMHPSVEPSWAGFWSLDDHRGGPPRSITGDRAANPQEVLAAIAVREALTTVPASVGRVVMNVASDVAVITLRDAAPTAIMLVGHEGPRNPLVSAMLDFARTSGLAGSIPALAAD